MIHRIQHLARKYLPAAIETLREAVRLPADYVDRPVVEGGDPRCGLSNHEGPRIEYLRRRVLELGAVDGPQDVGVDAFGNLWWRLEDPEDGVPAEEKTVIYLDGHTDTVQALRSRWHEAIGDVRGRGLLQGVELVTDRTTKTPADEFGQAVTAACFQRGLHLNIVQLPGSSSILRIAPPLSITEEEADEGLEKLKDAVNRARHREEQS